MAHAARWTASILVTGVLLLATPAHAQQDLGHKTLGTLGLEAGSPPEPGLYVANGILLYGADRLNDRNGAPLPVGLDITAFANVIGVGATVKLGPAGTSWSASVSVPMAHVNLNVDHPAASIDRFGLGDLYVQPVKLGWRLPGLDLVAGYAFYAPTGEFEPGGGHGVGRGQWTHELSAGGTVYFDPKKTWSLSALASFDVNQRKRGVDITRGDTFQIQGGLGKKLLGLVEVGLAGYALWQVTDDSGTDLPQALQGARDRTYGLGPEVNVLLPPIAAKLTVRYAHDFASRSRPQGQILTIGLTIAALR